MQQLFENVLTASFHGSIVILAVLLLRLVLKSTPRKFLCLLWLLAGLRLLMPFEIQSTMSLQPELTPMVSQQLTPSSPQSSPSPVLSEKAPDILPETPVFSSQDTLSPVESPAPSSSAAAATASRQSPALTPSGMLVLSWVWLFVVLCFLGYSLISYLRLRFQVRCAVKIPGGWECDTIDTAFILGFLRPQIYIPMGMPASIRRYILAHEQTHLEKGDHWFKMIGFLTLSLHWFNPLVWVAYTLLCKDIEIACDERVVQFMDLTERKAYSAALLRCSASRMHFSACPVAFGEVSVKARIKSVLNYKKPGFWISLAGIAAIAFVAICLVTSPVERSSEDARPVVSVSTVDELLDALASDTVIELQPGTYDLTTASTYGQTSGNSHYVWVDTYDGFRLELSGLKDLTLRGSGKSVTELVTRPRYADVLLLKGCTGITLEGFTAGHTDGVGECTGGVIALESCSDISMDALGLYGCGVVGLTARDCTGITLTGSDIYDCSSGAVTLTGSDSVTISGCSIERIGSGDSIIGGYSFLSIESSDTVSVTNCKFSDSTLSSLLFQSASGVTVQNCVFTGNRVRVAAFDLQGNRLTLVDNTFQDNTIRTDYTQPDWYAVDENGDPVTLSFSATGDTRNTANPTQLEVHVSTVDEFLSAIGSDRCIVLDAPLYDLSTATGYGTVSGENYLWQDIFDGPGLIIRNVSNMTIRSSDGDITGHTISATPRYADVLTFSACQDITLSGFTAGHTKEPGSCAGGVLKFQDSSGITVDSCGLFGCGILGVSAEFSQNLTISNCDIYECSEGGIKMYDCDGIRLDCNTYRDLGGPNTSFNGCTAITVVGDDVDGDTFSVDPAPAYAATAAAAPSETSDLYYQLELAAENFFAAYTGTSESALRAQLGSSYDDAAHYNPPTLHPEGGSVQLVAVGIPSGYSFDLANNGIATVTLCMRSSSGLEYLTLVLVPEDGWKVLDYYPDTAPDILETNWVNDCGNRLSTLTRENYTGKILFISDPSKVFLGLSTQDGFSADIPGKRLDEIMDAYPGTIAAVNAGAFFDDGTASTAVGSQPLGLTISQGKTADSSYQQLHPGLAGFVGFDTSNKLVVCNRTLTQEEAASLHIRDGCAIGPALIIDGQVNQAVLETSSGLSARTAIGQLSDGTVVFLCINGRVFDSVGASYEDMIDEMQALGAVNACLLEGGSATGMMCTLRGDEPELVTNLQQNQSQPRRLPTYWMVQK